MEIFKTIYINLKRNEDANGFREFYNIVEGILGNIDKTIFVDPKFYSKRRSFFHVISVIWLNAENVEFIYKIHDLVRNNLKEGKYDNFYQYLNDITGLLEPIDVHIAFEVFAELIMDDLDKLFQEHFADPEKVKAYFSNSEFMKVFCKLAYSLVSDINRKLFFETHTKIPLQIHKLLSPVLTILCQGGGNYDFPKTFSTILEKTVCLNPLADLICFSDIADQLK